MTGLRARSLGLAVALPPSRLARLGATGAAIALALTHVVAQSVQPDWKALEPEMMEQFQTVLRFDTRNPSRQRAHRRRLPEGRVRQGRHSRADLRARRQPLERRRALEGQRQEAADPDHGSQRRGHGRRGEMEVPAVQRDARRRLGLRPRHGRRQGQPDRRPDDDAAAEAVRTCRSIAT